MSAEPLELGLAAIANGLRLLLEGLSVTTASPSADHLIQLAVVAVIRTVLNVFLARELASERTGAEP
ncbi:MAG: DUF1622 domain-containing protein [Cyanobium sp.]